MADKKPPKDIQTGRNLPHRFNSYSPGHRNIAKSQEEVIPEQPRHKIRKWLLLSFLFLVILVVGAAVFIGLWDIRNISSAESKMFGTNDVFSLLSRAPLKGADSGRVNILLVGYSVDDPGHSGAQLTDSIIVLSMSTTSHTGYILSVPRDLAVNLGSGYCKSGGDYCKINEAYEDGGMSLLEQTVSTNFQIPIDYYAIIDYTAVRDVVDAIGGIDVTINSPDGRLYDPNRDFTTHGPLVDLTNGVHHLDGEQALDLTRA